jgi:hypothetical protein
VSVELCDLPVPFNLPGVRRLDGTGCSNGDAAVMLMKLGQALRGSAPMPG